jgi:hypothetical protein
VARFTAVVRFVRRLARRRRPLPPWAEVIRLKAGLQPSPRERGE